MSVLGVPYRIMYLSTGHAGLTDVMAVVFKPDKTTAGIFPLTEIGGVFAGCYYYDYVSSTSDKEGEYFSRVVSPSEGRTDIVRFSLFKGGSGEGVGQSLSPNPLVAYIINEVIDANINLTNYAVAVVEPIAFTASFESEPVLTATVLEEVAEASLSANETLVVARYC